MLKQSYVPGTMEDPVTEMNLLSHPHLTVTVDLIKGVQQPAQHPEALQLNVILAVHQAVLIMMNCTYKLHDTHFIMRSLTFIPSSHTNTCI